MSKRTDSKNRGGEPRTDGIISILVKDLEPGTYSPHLLSKWRCMVSRCYGKRDRPTRYQLNGIKMCDEWLGDHGFENFQKWAYNNGYPQCDFIDRIDTFGDYSPENCRFVTQKENNRNRRDTVFVTYHGKEVKLCELCERLHISYSLIYGRLKKAKTNCVDNLLYPSKPSSKGHLIEAQKDMGTPPVAPTIPELTAAERR